jgi:hypothetical protein
LYRVQVAFAREVEDFNTAVGQLAHMPSNQFLSVQSLGVGKFGDSEIAQRLRHFGRVAGGLLLLASAGRYRACGCGLHACDSFQFALHRFL